VTDHLQKISDHHVQFFAAPEEDIERVVQSYPHDYLQQVRNLVVSLSKTNSTEPAPDTSVVELADTIIIFALANRASDIHLEPYAHRLLVRFRVDGILHHIIDLPETLSQALLNRLKLMSKMKLDQKNTPQDGKIDFSSGQFGADIRASVAPLITGEKMVLRLLGHRHRAINLTDLGLSGNQLKTIVTAAEKKQGMIVVCGPTGAGKTTTLYALMKRLNSEQVNIATVEDPVEYDLEGVNQIQVQTATGLTYAEGLKITLRQDPDIIMLSAIRDLQTAHLANIAALSGHVVLTTLDTPDAVGAIARLLEMQIEPFPLATSLNLIIGQRLVRTICQNCRLSYDLSDNEREIVAGQLKIKPQQVSKRLYRGKGCGQCGNTGYRGRIGIFEILIPTEAVKKLIIDRADIAKLYEQARKDGLTTLREDGIQKVLSGITTVEELLTELSL
jgi:type II secretory ATPase GspE/PulE/Tfp pilus assembly ATPase PilB-like protein